MGKACQKSLTDVGMISGEAHCLRNGVYSSPVFLF